MDTYVDDDLHPSFAGFCERKAKDNCKVSWWNFSGGTTDEFMKFYWNNVSFTEVTGLNPPENTYYNSSSKKVLVVLSKWVVASMYCFIKIYSLTEQLNRQPDMTRCLDLIAMTDIKSSDQLIHLIS